MVELYTLDINFDNLENLNSSIEKVRTILDNFKQSKEITGYYLMRYNGEKLFLGIKILFNNFQNKDKFMNKIKEQIKTINGYKNIGQDKAEGDIKDNLPLICSISMEFRNKIWDLLKCKPTDKEFLHITHYLANPLLLSYIDEDRIKNLK
jgi:hypothetical protein